MRFAATIVATVVACGDSSPPPTVVAGERIGDVELGMRWADVRTMLGEPPAEPVVFTRVGQAKWPGQTVEVLFTSPDEATLDDEAIVIGVASTADGRTRAAIQAKHGAPGETYGGRDYYATGLAVEYGDDDVVDRVAVFAPQGSVPISVLTPLVAPPPLRVDGRSIPIVDMHLHPGEYATMAPTGKAFITQSLPAPLQIYGPELLDRLSDPWARDVGIAEQTQLAGVDHAVLFAVYAPQSTGTFSNEALLSILGDPRNRAADGRPWAWGMASIDFDGWTAEVAASRLAALRDDLAEHPDLLVGIKLAHPHQGVRIDDAAYHGVYDVASAAGVPVLLHTGFSPFPGTKTDPIYYDPITLEAVLATYPGVNLVLSHVGQGDARSVAHALDLAAAHDRVWLEISALGRPLLVDLSGTPVSTTEPQYPAVLAAIRDRGLVDRALFASDGPQYSGAIRSYVTRLVDGMLAAGYTADEIEAVMSGNFERLYTRTRARAVR